MFQKSTLNPDPPAMAIPYRMPPAPPIIAVTRELPGAPIAVSGAVVRQGPAQAFARAGLLEHVRGATVAVTMFSDVVDGAFLDSAGPALRGVCNFAVGYNNIDLAECRRRGVVVTNAPDSVTEGTANLAMGLLLAVSRRILEGDRFVRSGAWVARAPLGMAEFMGPELAGRVMHIVGAGRIGYATALRARAFGMDIVYTARSRKLPFEMAPLCGRPVDLDEGLAMAHAVSVHTPLTDETRHLLSRERIALLGPDAIVINTARGAVIDESALAEALASGAIFGAGLDVFEHEPRLAPGLSSLPNVVMTPHIGSAERRWRDETARICEANAAAIVAGIEPPNRVA
jgi:glyoxylate reductase